MLILSGGLLTQIRTSRSECGNVSGCSTNMLNVLKSAVFAPIPSARVRIAIAVNPGDLWSWRKANFRSFISFSAQCLDRIDKSGASRGHVTGEQCHQSERRDCHSKCPKIEQANPEQHTIKSAAGRECADQP